MAIATLTEQTYPTLHLYLHAPVERHAHDLDRLVAIFDKYIDWEDPLSLALYEWGTDLFQIDLAGMTEEDTLQKMDQLFSKVLISSFDHTPLTDTPILYEGLVWNQRTFADYKRSLERIQPGASPL